MRKGHGCWAAGLRAEPARCRLRCRRPHEPRAGPGTSPRSPARIDEPVPQERQYAPGAARVRPARQAEGASRAAESRDAGSRCRGRGCRRDQGRRARAWTHQDVDVGERRAVTGSACCWAAPWPCCSGPASWRWIAFLEARRPRARSRVGCRKRATGDPHRRRARPRRAAGDRDRSAPRSESEVEPPDAATGTAPARAGGRHRRSGPEPAGADPAPEPAAVRARRRRPGRRHAGHAGAAGPARTPPAPAAERRRNGRLPASIGTSAEAAASRGRRRCVRAVRDRHPLRGRQGRGAGPRAGLRLVRAGRHARPGLGPVPSRRLFRARRRRRSPTRNGRRCGTPAPPTRAMSAPCTTWAS